MAIRIGVIAGEIHADIADEMLARTEARIAELRAELVKVVRVPGSLETPIAAARLMERHDVDCIAVIGYIERGDTLYGEQIGLVVSLRLKQLEADHGKPVGIGIIGPGATRTQALERLHYGADAAAAAIRMCRTLSTV